MGDTPHSAGKAAPATDAGILSPVMLGLPAWGWALGGLLFGLLITAGLVLLEWNDLLAEARQRHAQTARYTASQVERRLESSGLLLRALQSAYLVSGDVDQPRFESIVDNLEARRVVPSLLAIAFAPRSVDARGRVHYAYTRVAPREPNRSLLGLDVISQPENLSALARARDLDQPVLSAPFRLHQVARDPRDLDGVVIRLPVFTPGPAPSTVDERQRRERGAVALSLRVRPLLLNAMPAPLLQHYRVRIDDVTDAPRVLFSEGHVQPGQPAYASMVAFGGRRWQLSLQPSTAVALTPLLWTSSIGGVIASILMGLLLWSIADTRRRAVTIGWQMSARFRESEERFRTLNELLPALVLLAREPDGRIVYANAAACARLGARVVEDTPLATLFEDETLHHRLQEHGEESAWSNVEAVLVSLNGDRFWASTSISRVRLDGRDNLLMVATDTSEQRQLTELLSYQASHDTLTELYNRREFERHVQRALYGLGKDGPPAALLYLDLDQFKLINDTSGHLAGDQLLSQLALAMAEQLRGGDILARLGGDEFGILAHDTQLEGAQSLAERLRSRVEGFVYVWQQRSYSISVSIGVVLLDRPGLTLGEALSQADAACYVAKDHGRNRVHFYSEQDDETVRRRGEMEWANRLRWVVDENRLLLYYQEVAPLRDGGAEGPYIELLLRLHDEDGRLVFPGAFLPAAERYGMMPLLDRWVIAHAFANFDRLHASGRRLGCCAINLAASTLEDDGLADYVLDLIARHGVEPARVCFEITETEAMRNIALAMRFIERVRAIGCKVALDDFGAGMSSFGYLKNLPVDTIKIDGSFVRDIESDPMSRSIVEAICKIGHQRGLDVVAEWVADPGVVPLLRELGVDFGQGFALHQPEAALFQRDDPDARAG